MAMVVILLQIVMVSLGTHVVNKSWDPVQKTISPKLKILGPLCDQIDKIYSFVNHTEN